MTDFPNINGILQVIGLCAIVYFSIKFILIKLKDKNDSVVTNKDKPKPIGIPPHIAWQMKRGSKESAGNYIPEDVFALFADMDSHQIRICNGKIGGDILSGEELYKRYKKYGIYLGKSHFILGCEEFNRPNRCFIFPSGTTEDCESYIGKAGELIEDIDLKRFRLMDGVKSGGYIL